MTLGTKEVNSRSKNEFYSFVEKINQIINALGEFEGKFDKKFNLSKLAQYLNLNELEINNLIDIILNFQEKFESIFNSHRLIKKVINQQVYFTLEKRDGIKLYLDVKTPKEIHIKINQLNHLCDIVYIFQFIQKGKGFNLEPNNTELLNNLNKLKEKHPYFFLSQNNNVIYPSKLGMELGNLIRSYNKSNQVVIGKKIEINKHTFIID